MTSTTPGRGGITFQWEVLRRFPTVLPGFILISLVVHSAAFFLFRVVYPPQATMSAPPPAITILDPTRPDHQSLLLWIESEDPAPAVTGSGDITQRLLQLPYRPSFAALKTPPLKASESQPKLQYPPAHNPLAIIRSAERKKSFVQEVPEGEPTRVQFSAGLAARLNPETLPDWPVQTKTTAVIEPATFLLGVTDRGNVQFVLPQRSSGNSQLDREAAAYLGTMKLGTSTAPVTWGYATVAWGRDVYTAPPSEP